MNIDFNALLEAHEQAVAVYENANIYNTAAIRDGLRPLLDITTDILVHGCDEIAPHARWKRVSGDMHSGGYAIRCTACNKYHFVHSRYALGGLYGHDELFEEPPRCSNCGAYIESSIVLPHKLKENNFIKDMNL